jgi:hypothetical protein
MANVLIVDDDFDTADLSKGTADYSEILLELVERVVLERRAPTSA